MQDRSQCGVLRHECFWSQLKNKSVNWSTVFSVFFFWEVFCSLFFLLELFPPSALVFRHFPSSVTFFRYVLCALVICGVIGSPDMYCSLCVPKLFFILFYVYSCSNHIILQQRKGPVSVLQHKKRGHRIPSETPPKRWIRLLFLQNFLSGWTAELLEIKIYAEMNACHCSTGIIPTRSSTACCTRWHAWNSLYP